jgi:hypothetical protein
MKSEIAAVMKAMFELLKIRLETVKQKVDVPSTEPAQMPVERRLSTVSVCSGGSSARPRDLLKSMRSRP